MSASKPDLDRSGYTALALLLLIAGLALAAPWLAAWRGIDAESIDLMARQAGPSLLHPLGTDELGRDLLARLIDGGRVSLLVGFLAAALASLIGAAIGLLAGWFGGRIDTALMRVTDLALSLPILPLLIILAAIDPAKLGLGPIDETISGVVRISLILGLFGWTTVARLVRAGTMSLKERDFVRAATALGATPATILWRHILPNLMGPLLVATSLAAGHAILAESVLSFLGLGIQPPTASWGNMLNGAQDQLWERTSLAIWPGAAIFLTVVALNLLGDSLTRRA